MFNKFLLQTFLNFMKHISKGAKFIQGIVWEWLPYMPSQKTTNYQLLVKNGEPIYYKWSNCFVTRIYPVLWSSWWCFNSKPYLIWGSIKKYEKNVSVYHIYVMKIITNKLIYALTLVLLICEVQPIWWNGIFLPNLKKNPICFVTTEHGNVQNMTSRWHTYSL